MPRLLRTASFTLTLLGVASLGLAQCPHAGNNVGSIPYPPGGPYEGVSFRVWAPHATAVQVSDSASGESVALVEQGSTGYWCKDIPGVGVNLAYDYVITSAAGTVTRRDPNARVVTSETGHAVTYDPAAYVWQTKTFTPPALNKLVIYEVDIGQFNAGPSGWGTFQAAIAQLGHVSGMGFTAIELLPVTQSDGIHANPYASTDQYAVDNSELGGPDNLKAFVDACHQNGLAVIFDVVHNHWGPYNLADFDFDGWETSSSPGGIYFYNSSGNDPYGSPYGPRPNYSNAIVQSYILGQIGMWFNEYRGDGLRWDSISNIYNAWSGGVGNDPNTGKPGVSLPDGIKMMQSANTAWQPTFKIAEDLSFSSHQALDTQPIASGGLGFDAQWNATLAYFVRKDFPASQITLSDIVSGMTSTFNNVYLQSVAYVESQDELTAKNSRLYQLVDPQDPTSRSARKKAALGAAILFTSPELPMIYQGDEFLDPSWLDNRTMLDWTNATTWSGIVQLYSDLVHLRTNSGGASPGLSDANLNIYQQDKNANVLVYDRYSSSAPGTDDVIVVANLSGTVFNSSSGYEIGLPYGGNWQVLFNSDSTVYSSDFGNVGPVGTVAATATPYAGQPFSAVVPIGDYSVLILSQVNDNPR